MSGQLNSGARRAVVVEDLGLQLILMGALCQSMEFDQQKSVLGVVRQLLVDGDATSLGFDGSRTG